MVSVEATHPPPSPVATVAIAPTTAAPTIVAPVPTITMPGMTGAVAFLVSDRTERASMEAALGEVSGDYHNC